MTMKMKSPPGDTYFKQYMKKFWFEFDNISGKIVSYLYFLKCPQSKKYDKEKWKYHNSNYIIFYLIYDNINVSKQENQSIIENITN